MGSIDAIPLIRKTRRHKPEGYRLDKGYDTESIHKVIREEAQAEAQIPIRSKKALTGKYRQMMLTGLDYDKLRNKECKLRDVCYNVYRYCKLFILELKGFYIAITS
ncbi:MAG: hypothetical protein SVK08_08645 [Halobacteriota archaeon]|nr:hypothetical protein [Halobacteriota archaeon]